MIEITHFWLTTNNINTQKKGQIFVEFDSKIKLGDHNLNSVIISCVKRVLSSQTGLNPCIIRYSILIDS